MTTPATSTAPGGTEPAPAGRAGGSLEFIRIWAHEVAQYEARGWHLQCVRYGLPSEILLGPGYADCIMVRAGESDGDENE